jgi:prefoldin alpha subunit
MLEQQSQELKKQLEMLETQRNEMEALKQSVENIKDAKGQEILASLGKGLFIKSRIEDDKILVNVGEKILVKKNARETVEIISKQTEEMGKISLEIRKSIEDTNSQLLELVQEAQNIKDA